MCPGGPDGCPVLPSEAELIPGHLWSTCFLNRLLGIVRHQSLPPGRLELHFRPGPLPSLTTSSSWLLCLGPGQKGSLLSCHLSAHRPWLHRKRTLIYDPKRRRMMPGKKQGGGGRWAIGREPKRIKRIPKPYDRACPVIRR